MPLAAPAKGFSRLVLPTVSVPAEALFRISRYRSGEPYFGDSGANRFDDPRKKKAFGTCYAGLTLGVAFAETVLHDEEPVDGHFEIPVETLWNRYVVQFSGEPLVLANLTGADLKRLGADGSLSTEVPYAMPQRWARAIHKHPLSVDGFQYVSRHLNTELAVVLFDRAEPKLRDVEYTRLPDFAGALRTVLAFKIKWL